MAPPPRGEGVEVSPDTQHEVITSIYFFDPNGYMLEITVQTRAFVKEDASDATLTMEAAMRLETEGTRGGADCSIDDVWRAKAQLIEASQVARTCLPFTSLMCRNFARSRVAREQKGYAVSRVASGYFRIEPARFPSRARS